MKGIIASATAVEAFAGATLSLTSALPLALAKYEQQKQDNSPGEALTAAINERAPRGYQLSPAAAADLESGSGASAGFATRSPEIEEGEATGAAAADGKVITASANAARNRRQTLASSPIITPAEAAELALHDIELQLQAQPRNATTSAAEESTAGVVLVSTASAITTSRVSYASSAVRPPLSPVVGASTASPEAAETIEAPQETPPVAARAQISAPVGAPQITWAIGNNAPTATDVAITTGGSSVHHCDSYRSWGGECYIGMSWGRAMNGIQLDLEGQLEGGQSPSRQTRQDSRTAAAEAPTVSRHRHLGSHGSFTRSYQHLKNRLSSSRNGTNGALSPAAADSSVSGVAKSIISRDVMWLFLAVLVIAIAEDGAMSASVPVLPIAVGDSTDAKITAARNFSLFGILFEVISAYGTVGLSLGYPGSYLSLCSQFTVFSKLVIIAVMIAGRHRGLPFSIDPAVHLPSLLNVEVRRPQSSSRKLDIDAEAAAVADASSSSAESAGDQQRVLRQIPSLFGKALAADACAASSPRLGTSDGGTRELTTASAREVTAISALEVELEGPAVK